MKTEFFYYKNESLEFEYEGEIFEINVSADFEYEYYNGGNDEPSGWDLKKLDFEAEWKGYNEESDTMIPIKPDKYMTAELKEWLEKLEFSQLREA